MLTSLRISSSVSSFFLTCFRCYIAYRVSFIFRLNAFLASVWIRLLALLTAGKGKRTGMYAEIFVSWILQLFAILFFDCYFFRKLFFFPRHLPTPTTHTHTHDPRPTTHDSGLHPVQINPVEQVLIKPSLAIPDQPSPTSPDQPSLASPDQTQSRRSSSNPVEPVQINPV